MNSRVDEHNRWLGGRDREESQRRWNWSEVF